MRALSKFAAARCENAKSPKSKCRCRCGGEHHGSARVTEDAPRENYEALPDGDPHQLQAKKKAAENKATGEQS
jgi:hypothetical protein